MDFTHDVKSVSWVRNSLYNNYPDNHIARDCGTAYNNGIVHDYDIDDVCNIASWGARHARICLL